MPGARKKTPEIRRFQVFFLELLGGFEVSEARVDLSLSIPKQPVSKAF